MTHEITIKKQELEKKPKKNLLFKTIYHIDSDCRTCAASRRSSFTLIVCVSIWPIWETRNSCLFISGKKKEWESPPSILVTKNPNWSQRSGTETGCVKGRY